MRKIIFAVAMTFCLMFTFVFATPQAHASSKAPRSHTLASVKVQPDVYRDNGCNLTDIYVATTSGTLCFAGVGWSSVKIYNVTSILNDGYFSTYYYYAGDSHEHSLGALGFVSLSHVTLTSLCYEWC